VQEHIERVLTHVRRLEHSAETAVQMHFSALGHRTNDIMRTLTVLTAVFLPLNLITGFFGMNFDALPLIHSSTGLWFALGAMLLVGAALLTLFWRKRYLGTCVVVCPASKRSRPMPTQAFWRRASGPNTTPSRRATCPAAPSRSNARP
jgi:protein-S-isoprenylcysteine O-methyltransferase Ste14